MQSLKPNGVETWTLKKVDEQRLKVFMFEKTGLRKIVGVPRTVRLCNYRDLPSISLKTKLKYFGHVNRMGSDTLQEADPAIELKKGGLTISSISAKRLTYHVTAAGHLASNREPKETHSGWEGHLWDLPWEMAITNFCIHTGLELHRRDQFINLNNTTC